MMTRANSSGQPRVRTVRDVVYRVAEGVPLRLDLHLPADKDAQAAIVYFHGGSWRRGRRTDYEVTRAVALAARGFAVATVEYRLTTEARFPAQLADACASVKWMQDHGDLYGIKTTDIGAWGASAGGNLAALLALGCSEKGPAVGAAMSWFAPLDLSTIIAKTPLERAIFPDCAVEQLLGHPYDPSLQTSRNAEPLSMVTPDAAPIFLMTGDRDRVVDPSASRKMHDHLVYHGVPSTYYMVGGAGHEDPAFDDPLILDVVAAFFRKWLTSENSNRK